MYIDCRCCSIHFFNTFEIHKIQKFVGDIEPGNVLD